jgi:hypothetical protein
MTTNSNSAAPTPLLPELRWQWALLGLLIVVSLLLNLLIPPEAPIHPNTHGIQEIRAILDPGVAIAQGEFYGPLYVGFMRLVCAMGGWQEGTIYTTNAILGALSVLALFGLARTFGFSTGGALLAAGLLAIHPAQIWLAGSEGPMMIYLLLVLSGLTLLTQGLQRGAVGLLWAGSLAISLACRLHVLTLAALPLALGAVVYARTKYELPVGRRFRIHAVLAAVSCVALWGTHLWDLRWVPEAFAGKVRGESSLYQFTAGNILFDPTLTAVAVLVLAGWGALLLYRHNRSLALLLAWAFLVLVPSGLLVNSLRTDAVRYQTPTHWVLFLLAGAVISFSPQIRRAASKVALAFLGAAIFANAAYGWSVVSQGTIATRAYTFTRQAVATIEGPATLHLPHLEDGYRRLLVDIPIYDEPIRVVRRKTPATGDLVYLGLDCYRDPYLFAGRFNGEGQRLECARACGELNRVPVAEATLHHNPPRWGHHHLFHVLTVDSPTIGLYRCQNFPAANP